MPTLGIFFSTSQQPQVIGFLRGGGCPRKGSNWGTLRIPREDWGTLGNIRETPPLEPPLNNPIIKTKNPYDFFRP